MDALGPRSGGDDVNDVLEWLTDSAQWSGPAGIPTRILEHLGYTGLTLLIGVVIAVPLGAVIGHTGRGTFLVAGIGNGLRAIPELGLLTLLVMLTVVGLLPVILSLVVLAIPPLLAGTYAGVRNVDRSVVDAARGMGMRESGVLFRVELPNALPLILGGLRGATLQVIATATIAAYVALDGLGRYIIDGNAARDYTQMAGGAVVIAVLALAVEGILALVQRLVVSPGLRTTTTRQRRARALKAPTTELVQEITP